MPTSDILTRIGALLMMVSAAWNGVISFLWILSLIWFLVGFLWFVPLFIALAEGVLALVFLALGHNKAAIAGPLLGMCASVCNFNFIGIMIDFCAIALIVGGYISRAQEDKAVMI